MSLYFSQYKLLLQHRVTSGYIRPVPSRHTHPKNHVLFHLRVVKLIRTRR